MLALSNANEVYFWGQHNAGDVPAEIPHRIRAENIVDIGAIRGCQISAFETAGGEVYFWGFAYGHRIPDPVLTRFTSMTDLFLSLDTPILLEPMEFVWKEPTLEKLGLIFDDKVS